MHESHFHKDLTQEKHPLPPKKVKKEEAKETNTKDKINTIIKLVYKTKLKEK